MKETLVKHAVESRRRTRCVFSEGCAVRFHLPIVLAALCVLMVGLTACADYDCNCNGIAPGVRVIVETIDGEPVSEFRGEMQGREIVTSDGGKRTDAIAFACPDGPNPPNFYCEPGALVERLPANPNGYQRTVPVPLPDSNYRFVVVGVAAWEGLSFDGTLGRISRALEAYEIPGNGCCSGRFERIVQEYRVVLNE